MFKSICIGSFLFFLPVFLFAQTFTEVDPGIVGVQNSDVCWGDYDSDGDLDILLNGTTTILPLTPTTRIYRHDDNDSFVNINADLENTAAGSVDWVDFDHDGQLDILLTGLAGLTPTTRIYSGLTETGITLEPSQLGEARWGDYDGDGDFDVLLAGFGDSLAINAKVYRNEGDHIFTDTNALLLPVLNSAAAWGDYDADGDLDIVLTGLNLLDQTPVSILYTNLLGVYVPNITVSLEPVQFGALDWGDYDADGDLDLFLAGLDTTLTMISKIYRNDNGSLIDIEANLTGISGGDGKWGDVDNDGDLDLLITGNDGLVTGTTKLYLNEGNDQFTELDTGLPNLRNSACEWGDYDNDGDLDILLSGYLNLFSRITRIYRNEGVAENQLPQPPSAINANIEEDNVTFSWSAGSDAETPLPALTYNIYLHTSDGEPLLSGMADPATGWRQVVRPGNRGHERHFTLENLPTGSYVWSVQTLDQSLMGSAFAPIDTFYITISNAYPFRDTGAEITGVSNSAVAWGDYDQDDDLDFVLTGTTATNNPVTLLYRNDHGDFVHIDAGFPAVSAGDVAWGDYDRDGDLDLALTGMGADDRISAIYRNDDGTFIDIEAGLIPVNQSGIAWGDYDNDGDLDLLLSGLVETGGIFDPYIFTTTLYRNDGNDTFHESDIELQPVYQSDVAWGDYDNDGDLDLLLSGNIKDNAFPPYDSVTKLYRNDGNDTFTEINAGLIGVNGSSVDWGDVDNDGDLDILLTGGNAFTIGQAKIYRNDNGAFIDIGAELTPVSASSAQWGDFDNDGWLDIALTGSNTLVLPTSRLFHNEGNGTFTEIDPNFVDVQTGAVAWADFDRDGDLDILLTGLAGTTPTSKIYRNDGAEPNERPSAPTDLTAASSDTDVTLQWQPATDAETPAAALSYNLRVGTVPGAFNIVAPHTNVQNGYRQVVAIGNVGQNLTWTLSNLPQGDYFWAVQAVDHAFAGSMWSEESSFQIGMVAVEPAQPQTQTPTAYALKNYPNPFNPQTTITFDLPVRSHVKLRVYDLSGQPVAVLIDDPQEAGSYTIRWAGTDDRGHPVNSGLYLYQLQTEKVTLVRTMVLLR